MAAVTPFPESPDWAVRSRETADNDLDAFESEGPTPEPAGSAIAIASERPPVSLAALKAAGIRVDGNEAIAIAQALCRALMTAQLLRRLKPEPDTTRLSSPVTVETVFVHASGRVGATVNDPRDVPTAIQSVGTVLSDILPTELILALDSKIISKAVASPPRFATLDELSEALAAFEQRNGRELIQAVYKRWEKLEGANTAVAPPPRPPDITPTLSPPELSPATSLRAGHHPVAVVAAVVLGASAVMGVSAWFLMSRMAAERDIVAAEVTPLLEARSIARVTGPNVAEFARPLPDEKVSRVILAGLTEVSALAPAIPSNERRAPAAPSPAVARAVPIPSSVPPISRPTGQQPLASIPPAMPRAEESAPSGSHTTGNVIRNEDGAVSPTDRATPRPGKGAPARATPIGGSWPGQNAAHSTYDARNPDVIPPIPDRPRLLAGLEPSSPGVRLDALTISVVVNADGTAYSVTAVNAPENMGEYVLLTAALAVVKSWVFYPATKDGVPVWYRLIVPLRAVTRSRP